jgi:hypothetical protein
MYVGIPVINIVILCMWAYQEATRGVSDEMPRSFHSTQ